MEHDYDFLIQLFPHILNHKHLYHHQILSKKKKTITIKFLVLFPTSKAKEDKFLIVKAEGKKWFMVQIKIRPKNFSQGTLQGKKHKM